MPAEHFLDTNVFVYAVDPTDQRKQQIARDLLRQGLADNSTRTSYQVTQEWLNVVLKLARVPLGVTQARAFVDRAILPITSVWPSAELFHAALDAHSRWSLSFYDALVVAAAQQSGARTLVSEDLQHGQRLGTVTVWNPFV
ncbi:MAG TPA: PIN domain-containing protein [Arachnia sp.]|nr:PIN domain-containing protein [Arachnia sp.]HMR14569.1 PIN domain-containing protein [Arachnia sp.]